MVFVAFAGDDLSMCINVNALDIKFQLSHVVAIKRKHKLTPAGVILFAACLSLHVYLLSASI